MRFSTVLFDLDGTISDPIIGIARSINFSLTEHGFSPLSAQELSRYIGPPLDAGFRSILGRDDPDLVDSCIKVYRKRYSEVGYSENHLYDGIEEMLGAIVGLGLTMAVCTSKRFDFAYKIITMFKLTKYFDFISGGDVGISKTKQIAGLLKEGKIDDCSIMIGDRDVDVAAAKENGLRSIGVLWGHGSESELQSSGPDYIVRYPGDIEKIMAQQQ